MIDAPYSLVRNIRQASAERITVAIFRKGVLVRQHIESVALSRGIPFNRGDLVKIMFTKGCQGAQEVCDIITVNPVTGAESVESTQGFTEPFQKTLMIACINISKVTGIANVLIGYEVAIVWGGGVGQAATTAAARVTDFNETVRIAEQEAEESEQALMSQNLQRASAPAPAEPAKLAEPAKAAKPASVKPAIDQPEREPEPAPEHKPSHKKKARKWPHSQ